MDFSAGHGYLLIGGLILVGTGLLILSLIVNLRVAHSVRDDVRHREKLLEYHRNIFSQLGVILIGIGVSLFIFFFQQNYQDQRRREADLQQVLAKLAARIARGAPLVESLGEFDALLDDGGAYISPELGGTNAAIGAQGAELGKQIREILLVERDVDIRDFDILNLSRDFESSFVVNELDPTLWFDIVRDESEIKYAITQLTLDYKDLKRSARSSTRCSTSSTMLTSCASAAGDFLAARAGFSATDAALSVLHRSTRSKPMRGHIRNG
ncbi:hypothetical protein [Mesorhizobium sp.]|uniref:hypothetical protein n=1 Tax=Mesorhizobium sp. TaxID=1871066 RepID=UPI0025E26A7B|nr:hypothetical protein [Mesorhizobium sp.]